MLESGLAKETQWYVFIYVCFYKCVSCILEAVSEAGGTKRKDS